VRPVSELASGVWATTTYARKPPVVQPHEGLERGALVYPEGASRSQQFAAGGSLGTVTLPPSLDRNTRTVELLVATA
jgi:hypothetical protein